MKYDDDDVNVVHLLADGSGHGDRERSDDASAQVISFSLLAERTKLFLLLIIQRVAVLRL